MPLQTWRNWTSASANYVSLARCRFEVLGISVGNFTDFTAPPQQDDVWIRNTVCVAKAIWKPLIHPSNRFALPQPARHPQRFYGEEYASVDATHAPVFHFIRGVFLDLECPALNLVRQYPATRRVPGTLEIPDAAGRRSDILSQKTPKSLEFFDAQEGRRARKDRRYPGVFDA